MDAASRRSVRLAPAVVALFILDAAAASSAQADTWKIHQTVTNNPPYEMRLVLMTTMDLANVERQPAAKITPGQTDSMTVSNGTTGHGVSVIAAYDLFDTRGGGNVYKGMVLARSGVDCEWWVNQTGVPACLDYSRYNCGNAVAVSWWNTGGPGDFYTQTDVMGAAPSALKGKQHGADDRPLEHPPADLPPVEVGNPV